MNRIRTGRPWARNERPWPGHARGPRVLERCRVMMAWAGRCLWLAVRTVIRAVRMAHDEQVRMWECIMLTSGAGPLTVAGPLRWVRTLDGYRLDGSHLPAQKLSETGRCPGLGG